MPTKNARLVRSLTLLVGASLAGPAYAQSASPEGAQLEEVVVEQAGGYRTTGTKSELEPIEAPMSYEVYDNDLLTARQVDSVNEALRYVPGVTPESRSTVTIFDQYTMRGFESYRNYYDGLPLQYNGLWNLVPQVDAFATQSIEVLKGPASVLYGTAPPGGMVNQTAKLPQSVQDTVLRGRLGTGSLRELALDSTGPLAEGVDYRIIALARRQDGQQVTTKEERYTLAPSLSWRISDATRLIFSIYHQQDPEMIPSTPLPALGTLHRASYGRLGSDAYAGDANWAGFDRDVTMVGWKLEHAFSDAVTFLQNFRYTHADAFQRNTYNLGLRDDGRTLDRAAYFTDEQQDGFVVDNQLGIRFGTGALRHRLLFGLEYQELDSKVTYGDTLGTNTPAIDLASPNYRLIDPTALPLDLYTERHRIDQRQTGFYVQDEVSWKALTVLAGLRWDRYKSDDISNSAFDGAPTADRTMIEQRHTSARLAAIWKFDNGWSPYVNFSESFEPVAGVDSLTGQAFEPTTARQIEAGLKYRSQDRRTELTAAWFDITKRNVVVNTPNFMQYTQNGEVRSKGLELALQHAPLPDLSFTLSLTDFDIDVTENELDPSLVGKTPVWVAERQASLWVNYFPTSRVELRGGVRYVGESQMDAANSDTVPSYTVADLALSYWLKDKHRIGLTVSNLFDKRYVGACFDANNCWMGAERRVELTLQTSF
jgi:iron complex outermembrane receptor protein